jgi:hypothetical protein
MHTKIILFFLIFACWFPASADWTNLNTGINDDLTGVVFFGNNGVVSGKKGLYYTTNGGSGAGSWTRFNVTGNPADSLIYNHTQFYHCTSNTDLAGYNAVYACGMDTVSHKAVIFQLAMPSMTYSLLYYGVANSRLDYVDFVPGFSSSSLFSVGDDGLLVQFSANNSFPPSVITTGITADFNTIRSNGNNGELLIGGNGLFWRGFITGTQPFTFSHTAYAAGSDHFKEFATNGSSTFGVGNDYFQVYNVSYQDAGSYDFGPLNAETVQLRGLNYFIGTDHGIFRTSNLAPNVLELQPSTAAYEIKEFWSEASATNFYACGDNGTLLVTTDNGGPTKPYAFFDFMGACVNTGVYLSGTTGSSTSCTWYIDNSPVYYACQGFSHTFPTLGDYVVKLIASNNTYSDTCTRTVHIVNPPQINLPVLVTDTLLCKSEVLDLTIQNTQPNVAYRLRKNEQFNTQYFGTSMPGNGGDLNYETLPVSQEGNYYIEAYSTIASCQRSFTDTIHIAVEHTTARMYAGRYNAQTGEAFPFYANTIDANHVAWTFPADAAVATASTETVTNQFSQVGHPTIGLVSWSDNGCYDSITATPVTVYTETNANDPNWMNRTRSLYIANDPYWFRNQITRMEPTPDGGHVVAGNYKNGTFPTQNGDSILLSGRGAFLMKYDSDGTLKWNVFIKQATNEPYPISGLLVDNEGNTYISGYLDYFYFNSGYPHIFDNQGDSIRLGSTSSHDTYLVKLDPEGRFLWQKTGFELYWGAMTVDPDNNLIVSASMYGNPYYYNGTTMDTLDNMEYGDIGVLTFAPEGSLVSMFKMHSNGDYTYLDQLTTDGDNNIYLTGSTWYNMPFYSSDQTLAYTINYSLNYSDKAYIAKYSVDGIFQWIVTSADQQLPGEPVSVRPFDMITTPDGTTYLSGANQCGQMLAPAAFYNTDGTTTSTTANGGDFFVAQISPDGVCEWIRTMNRSNQATDMYMDLRDGELNILGHLLNYNDSSYLAVTVLNPDGQDVQLSMGYQDYFVVTYDTTGLLKHVIKNGSNMPYMAGNFWAAGLFTDADGAIYVAMNFMGPHEGGPVLSDYYNFGNLVPVSYYEEPTVTKFHPNDGINITPGHHSNKLLHVCNGSDVTFEDGHTIYAVTQPMIYDAVLPAQSGIDSVITTTLTIEPYDPVQESVTLCRGGGYLFPDSTTALNIQSSQVNVSLQDMGYGCQLLTQTQITVPNPAITITLNAGVLSANVTTGTMNWADCNNNYSLVPGATNHTFVPAVNGLYALITDRGGCIDTSACVQYNMVGIEDPQAISFELYPNPTMDGAFAIYSAIQQQTVLLITDVSGKVVETYTDVLLSEVNLTVAPGVYFVHVLVGNELVGRKKLVSL